MMVCTGVNCGDLSGRKTSEILGGALSTNQNFYYIDMVVNDVVGPLYKHVGLFSHQSITSFVPENINIDSENDILTCDGGAIVDAYNFDGMADSEIEYLSSAIINNYSHLYPGYELTLVEGKFPLRVDGSLVVNDKTRREVKPIMSSHILCISNYKDFIKNNKMKVKK